MSTTVVPAVDTDRFARVYTAYRPRVEAFVFHQLRRPDHCLAEDLTQETFVRVLRDLGKARADDEHLFRWLAVIARRTVVDHYRLARNTRETAADTSDWRYANRDMTQDISGVCQFIRNGASGVAR